MKLPPMPTPHYHVGQLMVCTWYDGGMRHAAARIEADTYLREEDDWGPEQVVITLFPSLGEAKRVTVEGYSRALWHNGTHYELFEPSEKELASVKLRIALESAPKPEKPTKLAKPAKVKVEKPIKQARQAARNDTGGIQKTPEAPKAGSVQERVLDALKRKGGATMDELVAITPVYQCIWALRKRGIKIDKKKIDGVTILSVE